MKEGEKEKQRNREENKEKNQKEKGKKKRFTVWTIIMDLTLSVPSIKNDIKIKWYST